jgi:hypothetical protein
MQVAQQANAGFCPVATAPNTTHTSTPSPQDIALGFDKFENLGIPVGGIDVFAFNLNEKGFTQNPVSSYRWWYYNKLVDVEIAFGPLSVFATEFETKALIRSAHVHFNLQHISDVKDFISRYGGNGRIESAEYITAWELYIIKHRGYCSKTTFYEDGVDLERIAISNRRNEVCDI